VKYKLDVDYLQDNWTKVLPVRSFFEASTSKQLHVVALPITNYGAHMYRMSNGWRNLYRKNIRTCTVCIVLGKNKRGHFCIQYVTLSQNSSA
jgi:hypothetical protein